MQDTDKIVQLRNKAKEIYERRLPDVEAKRDKLATMHSNLTEELRIEVDKKQENEQRYLQSMPLRIPLAPLLIRTFLSVPWKSQISRPV